jgi:hypothetical protein
VFDLSKDELHEITNRNSVNIEVIFFIIFIYLFSF